jgi:hypothetical protein
MGWSYRRSAKFGPFRLNFSKSGVGVSAGIKGARVSTGPRGTYVNLGTNGFYYRQKVGGGYSAPASSGEASRSDVPNASSVRSLPSSFNYPTFPKHGPPRIVKTLGILSIPAVIVFVWILAVIGIATTSDNSMGIGSNENTRALAVTTPSKSVESSRERGLQAGYNYVCHLGCPEKGQPLNKSRLTKLAHALASKEHEDQEWQSGWMEGYNRAFETTLANVNDNRSLSTQSSSLPSEPTTLPAVRRTESNGYIRGPRGGCYYLSGSGRKVYVDRGFCN